MIEEGRKLLIGFLGKTFRRENPQDQDRVLQAIDELERRGIPEAGCIQIAETIQELYPTRLGLLMPMGRLFASLGRLEDRGTIVSIRSGEEVDGRSHSRFTYKRVKTELGPQ